MVCKDVIETSKEVELNYNKENDVDYCQKTCKYFFTFTSIEMPQLQNRWCDSVGK